MSVTTAGRAEIELSIGGMTCASCAARIEKKLNRMDGVDRHGQLRHREGPGRLSAPASSAADLIATVERTGYTAEVPAPPRRRRAGRRRRTPRRAGPAAARAC